MVSKKKAIIYSSSLKSNAGGGLSYFLGTANALKKIGYDVTCRIPSLIDVQKIREDYHCEGLKFRYANSGGSNIFQQIIVSIQEYFKYDLIVYHANTPPRLNFIRESYILCDFPLIKNLSLKERVRLFFWKKIIVNSGYTQKWIKDYWQKDSSILSPAVPAIEFSEKSPLNLLSIGRFHGGGRSKRQDLIIDAFTSLVQLNPSNWQLNLIGFVQDKKYMEFLREKSAGYNIHFYEDINLFEKERILSCSGIYIHACGYGINDNENPELAEHFGISVVEAMGAGCVPLVVPKGGPREIVNDGENGFYWENIIELEEKILILYNDKDMFQEMVKKSKDKSRQFSKNSFQKKLETIISNGN